MLGRAFAAMTLDVDAGLFGDDLDLVAERLDEAFSDRRADHVRTGDRPTAKRGAAGSESQPPGQR